MIVSLELAEQLAEKGLKIKTEKWWQREPMSKNYSCVFIGNVYHKNPFDEYIPAPSTDELLAVMPARMEGIGLLKIYKLDDDGYEATYASIYPQPDQSLSEALGRMCLYLLENGYVYSPEKNMIMEEKCKTQTTSI